MESFRPFFAQVLECHRYIHCILVADTLGTCHLKAFQPGYDEKVVPKSVLAAAIVATQPLSKVAYSPLKCEVMTFGTHIVGIASPGHATLIFIHKRKLDEPAPSAAIAHLLENVCESPLMAMVCDQLLAVEGSYPAGM